MAPKISDSHHLVNGTAYKKSAHGDVIKVLELARTEGKRIVIAYGDTKTGRVWNKSEPARGYVGRSPTTLLPVLLFSKRSGGGECIMDASILEIKESKGGAVLYKWSLDESLIVEETLGESPDTEDTSDVCVEETKLAVGE